MDNLVLLTFQEAEQHETSALFDIQKDEPEFFMRVTRVLKAVESHYT